jgi:hypothetical protein
MNSNKEFQIDLNRTNLKPTYDVGFWEAAYEMESRGYFKLLERKAKQIKYLKSLDLFSFSEAKAMKLNKQLQHCEEELNVMYGMKLFMDEMKNCYLDSSCKINETYQFKLLALEVENQKLRKVLNIKRETL